jgi:hypothetical chaperone protein
MFAGFDYGTSNCSIGVVRDGRVELLSLEGDATQIPSTLYAPRPEDQAARVAADVRGIDPAALRFEDLRFGAAALAEYLRQPAEGYFVKSPKSFLGARGVSEEMRSRLTAIVGAMMTNVKRRAEAQCNEAIEQVVIGRPVHFQGAAGHEEDARALAMLREAAHGAGFRDVTFQLEPMAAAMDYEARLAHEACVLVVDIGGGTTDCSFVRVGPARRNRLDRERDVLGHAGERIGGNDYDQWLALRALMPAFGFGDALVSGLPIPNTYFVDAVSINDVNAQQRFATTATTRALGEFVREARVPERVARLLALQRCRHGHRVVRTAEEAKIALSGEDRVTTDLGFVDEGLSLDVARTDLLQSSRRLLDRLAALVGDVVTAAGTTPDVIYLTGGMSGATVVREFLRAQFTQTPFVDGDHFASVTTGLALWAQRVYA